MPEERRLIGLDAAGDGREMVEAALFEMKRVIAGQDQMLERVLVCLLAGRPPPDRGRARSREDAHDPHRGTRARRHVPAHPVHARPRAGRPRRHAHLPPEHGHVRHRARPGLLQLPARGRDQPRARQGAVGAARGHAGADRHDRRHDARRREAVPRHGDAEPDRVRGHLSAARGAGRPLHAQGAGRLPRRRGRAHRRPARARRHRRRAHRDRAAAAARGCSRRSSRSTSIPRSRATPCGSRR